MLGYLEFGYPYLLHRVVMVALYRGAEHPFAVPSVHLYPEAYRQEVTYPVA